MGIKYGDVSPRLFHRDGSPNYGSQVRVPWEDLIQEKVKRRLAEQDVDFFTAEIEHWKQRCEELEIELLMLENSYMEPAESMTIKPKNRGLF